MYFPLRDIIFYCLIYDERFVTEPSNVPFNRDDRQNRRNANVHSSIHRVKGEKRKSLIDRRVATTDQSEKRVKNPMKIQLRANDHVKTQLPLPCLQKDPRGKY